MSNTKKIPTKPKTRKLGTTPKAKSLGAKAATTRDRTFRRKYKVGSDGKVKIECASCMANFKTERSGGRYPSLCPRCKADPDRLKPQAKKSTAKRKRS